MVCIATLTARILKYVCMVVSNVITSEVSVEKITDMINFISDKMELPYSSHGYP
jgi:hypothetical protein